MSGQPHPDAPPSYAFATGSSTTSQPNSNRLEVPGSRNGIPPSRRRSMEDEMRPLPDGWIRQFDSREQHQFFVDTKATPPRSIWHHPHDDEEYLASLSAEERERIQEAERDVKKSSGAGSDKYDTTDEEGANPPLPNRPNMSSKKPSSHVGGGGGGAAAAAVHSSSSSSISSKKAPLGRRLKDRLTGSTHEEREQDRQRREAEEREYYEAHMRFREAMQRAQMTGQPQFFAKDRDGKEIYIEPPMGAGGAYGGGFGRGYGQGGYSQGGYSQGGYGYNPYSNGPYTNPNARFIRPTYPYARPYGPGTGGGYGLPIAGGLLGGMLLGGLLF